MPYFKAKMHQIRFQPRHSLDSTGELKALSQTS